MDYAKRIAYAHTLSPEEIRRTLLSISHVKYRVILELCFLTMSRISEVCLMKTQDIKPWRFKGRSGYLLVLGTLKRQGSAKIVPLIKEPLFAELYRDVQEYLNGMLSIPGTPNTWVFGDPGIKWRKRGPTNGCRKESLREQDNLLRKRVWKYCAKHEIPLTPHLWRHARSAICQWTYHMTEQERQSLGNWKKRESMVPYERFGNPYELAAALVR